MATFGERAVFVDGRIAKNLNKDAATSGKIKEFFNRRFHDQGVDWQRLVYFQTISRKREGKAKRGVANLHFHALFGVPRRQTNKQIRAELERVFGKAAPMHGKDQFKITRPRWDTGHSFNGVTVKGPLGKLLYVQHGMGGTYNDLGLNEDGKRSRKAPIERLRCNTRANGLARGIPSNFNAKATLCDHVSTSAGRRAFSAWIKDEHEIQKVLKHRAAAKEPRDWCADTEAGEQIA